MTSIYKYTLTNSLNNKNNFTTTQNPIGLFDLASKYSESFSNHTFHGFSNRSCGTLMSIACQILRRRTKSNKPSDIISGSNGVADLPVFKLQCIFNPEISDIKLNLHWDAGSPLRLTHRPRLCIQPSIVSSVYSAHLRQM